MPDGLARNLRALRRAIYFQVIAATLFPLSVAVLGAPIAAALLDRGAPEWCVISLAMVFAMCAILILRAVSRRDKQQLQVLSAISDQQDVRSLPRLIALYGASPSYRVNDSVYAEVLKLLATLTPSDAEWFPKDAAYDLNRSVTQAIPQFGSTHRIGPARRVYLIAALDSLATLGCTSGLRSVARLAAGRTKDPELAQVVEAAKRCQLALEAHVADAANRLLRASQSPDGSEVLVRPAQGAGEADPSVLVRPAEPD